MVRAILLLFAVVVSSALAQVVRDPAEGQPGQPVPLFGMGVAGKDDTGKLRAIHVDSLGNLTLNPSGSPAPVKPNDGTNNYFPNAAAESDAVANPTDTRIAADNSAFNGATWDREHGNWHTTTGDTGTKTATFNGATQTNFDARGAVLTVILGTVSGTTPTLACQLQWSPDAGTTWITYGPALANLTASSQTGTILVYPASWQQALQNGGTPAGLATGSNVTLAMSAPLPRTWRILHTIGGTTPSFAISSEQVQYIK